CLSNSRTDPTDSLACHTQIERHSKPPRQTTRCAVDFRLPALVQGSEIFACYWICGWPGVALKPKLARNLEECTSLRGRHISLFLAASFTINRQIKHDLIPLGEQIIQSVNFVAAVPNPTPFPH